MAPESNAPEVISRTGAKAAAPAAGVGGALQRFAALPMQAKVAVGVGALFAFLWLFGSGGGNQAPNTSVNLGNTNAASPTDVFRGLESDRPALMQNVYEQNRRDMAEFRERIESNFQERDKALQDALAQNQELQRQMGQMMNDFTSEIKNLQSERAKDAERLAQLAEQQRQIEMNAATDGAGPVIQGRKQRINQVSLGPASGPRGGGLLSPLGRGLGAGNNQLPAQPGSGVKLPFIPPLGFVRATLLNGVDALTGGTPTPALARISGSYQTALNSTVSLDGCFVLIEFSGNISTERAVGKPARMTCVYPDSGAATYSLSGYVVDAEDGVIGVPGVLYEGDPTRLAAAIVADFAAGIGKIVVENQQTTSTNSTNGATTSALTGDETRAELAGGVDKSMSKLSEYLMERVNRVQPFIRLDATREINMVILNGTELRAEGSPWTLLFDANAADKSRARGTPANQAQALGQQDIESNANLSTNEAQ
ncbi:MAG: hypothetical protein EBQ80_01145 [Proteobacteria bacterium]|nr:hypothetical protein [Pseudomonadota bacterium]